MRVLRRRMPVSPTRSMSKQSRDSSPPSRPISSRQGVRPNARSSWMELQSTNACHSIIPRPAQAFNLRVQRHRVFAVNRIKTVSDPAVCGPRTLAGIGRTLSSIADRAAHAHACAIQNVGLDRRRAHITASGQFLHCAPDSKRCAATASAVTSVRSSAAPPGWPCLPPSPYRGRAKAASARTPQCASNAR